jgi:hypothetical protein
MTSIAALGIVLIAPVIPKQGHPLQFDHSALLVLNLIQSHSKPPHYSSIG